MFSLCSEENVLTLSFLMIDLRKRDPPSRVHEWHGEEDDNDGWKASVEVEVEAAKLV